MTLGGRALEYRRLRAPTANRAILVDPPLDQTGHVLATNQARRSTYHYEFHGIPLSMLSAQARREFISAARDYTSQYRSIGPSHSVDRLLVAGHQPEMFHPGVWCKNFALGALANRHAATAVNLIVDSDTIKRASLRVPGGSVAHPTAGDVPFDRAGAEIPYEERTIIDRDQFAGFGKRVSAQLKQLVGDPLIGRFWPRVLERSQSTSNIGACFAQARHRLEADWGIATLELPQSRVCGLPSFLWFCAHLLCALPKLHATYNAAALEYRRVNRIRSLNHPVPDLAADDGWLEAPFWVWSTASPRRKRLFARNRGNVLELIDRDAWRLALPVCTSDLSRAVEALARLPGQGVKLRSRAVITTMFARLLLGDLFVHGIGGAKYDELTDLIIREFFGIEPPRYLLLSGTLLLPIDYTPVRAEELRRTDQRLRDLAYHPEMFAHVESLPSQDQHRARDWIAQKRRWIDTPQTPENARARCRSIRQANESLQPLVDQERRRLIELRAHLAERLQAQSTLWSREYAFCLYPERELRPFLESVVAGV